MVLSWAALVLGYSATRYTVIVFISNHKAGGVHPKHGLKTIGFEPCAVYWQ